MADDAVEAIYPLSPSQEGMLFRALAEPESSAYIVRLDCQIEGSDIPRRLRSAWQSVIERYGVLRTTFAWRAEQYPVQVVTHPGRMSWRRMDWRGRDQADIESGIELLKNQYAQQGLDPLKGPLLHFTLVQITLESWRFIWTYHRILVDDWSRDHILCEVIAHMCAPATASYDSTGEDVPFSRYIEWLQDQNQAVADRYWRERFSGAALPTPLNLPGCWAPEHPGCYLPAECEFSLGQHLTRALHNFATSSQVSMGAVFAGAWAAVLAQYSGTPDVTFGLARPLRPPSLPGADVIVGMMTNTCPLRVRVDTAANSRDFLRRVHHQQAADETYAFSPLAVVRRMAGLPAGAPLFESVLVCARPPGLGLRAVARGENKLAVRAMETREQIDLPVGVHVFPGEDILVRVLFDDARFPGPAVRHTLERLASVLGSFVVRPDVPLRDILAEGAVRLTGGTDHSLPHPTLHEWVRAVGEHSPDSVALSGPGGELTYSDLLARADSVTMALRANGVTVGSRVAVIMGRCVATPVALIGALQAGAAYVPIDPDLPAKRIEFMLRDCSPVTALVDEQNSVLAVAGQVIILRPDGLPLREVIADPAPALVNGQAPAYYMYTSGSTGEPKGVVVAHGSAVNLLASLLDRLRFTSTDILLALTTWSFDISLLEIFGPLLAGGRAYIAPEEAVIDGELMPGLIDACEATVIQATPSLWRLLISSGWRGRPGLRALAGGEALPRDVADQLLGCTGEVWNLYGPTETTIWSTAERVRETPFPVTLGTPVGATQIQIVDASLRPQPAGAVGQVAISGRGVAIGYHGRPGLTAERFVPDPAGPPGSRRYLTGDLGRIDLDDRLCYLGRIDHQVKLRGVRIETGEIESALRECPGVAEAVVVLRHAARGDQLVAYYVVAASAVEPTVAKLRKHLAESLPLPFVPARYVKLAALPTTANGKLDRKALPESAGSAPETEAGVRREPRTSIEMALAKIWERVLQCSAIGLDDHFFELGGRSILMLRVVDEAAALGITVSPSMIWKFPTVGQLASVVEASGGAVGGGRSLTGRVGEISGDGHLLVSGLEHIGWEKGAIKGT